MLQGIEKKWKIKCEVFSRRCYKTKLGTLSKDDDDFSENVGKKMNLRSFKLNRIYFDPFKMSNAGDFSWS